VFRSCVPLVPCSLCLWFGLYLHWFICSSYRLVTLVCLISVSSGISGDNWTNLTKPSEHTYSSVL
jgi:hypothetical protein